jgi:hypothetical protein
MNIHTKGISKQPTENLTDNEETKTTLIQN